MENNVETVLEKLEDFFRNSLKYYGKEIALESNQSFSIEQIYDLEKQNAGEYRYKIQYGFPQSGCVSMNFGYSEKTKKFTVAADEVSIYVPPVGEELVMANFSQQLYGGLGSIGINLGADMGTLKYTGIDEIASNPNAVKLLSIATEDLCRAQILGECMLNVSVGSDCIPVCNSRLNNTKDKTL